jgi:hypothetical protein
MAFDKNYPNRKDQRKPYRKSKAFDRTCRNHGSCPYCELGRLHTHKRREPIDGATMDEQTLNRKG